MKKPAPSYKTQEVREVAELIRGRRTIDLFLQTPVPEELVRDAIEAATWAPNHHVTEPWRFYLLGEESKERCLDLCYDIVRATKGDDKAAFKRRSWPSFAPRRRLCSRSCPCSLRRKRPPAR